jgi:hypothetical protein
MVSAGCAHKVVSFSVEPQLVCAGERVKVDWDVEGRASLKSDRGGGDTSEIEVPSQGEQSPVVEKRTTFTIRALDANPADPPSFASKSVDVALAPMEKGTNTTCDPAARKCRGSFVISAEGHAVMVRTLGGPRAVQAGHARPAPICVSHGSAPICLSGDAKVDVSLPADGTWELETDLPADYAGPPDPQLRIQLGFGCP